MNHTKTLHRGITVKTYGGKTREGTLELFIDWDQLYRVLAKKAFFSTGRKTQILYGIIKAKATELGEIK